MKKIILTLGIALSFASCSDRADNLMSEVPVSKSEKSSINEKRNPNVAVMATFDFYLGRKSKHCDGFGVCGLAAFGFTIVELPPAPPKGAHRGSVVQNLEGNIEGEYILEAPLELEDTTLYIDEDISGKDENGSAYVIRRGEYELDSTIGEFGGYAFRIDKL